MAPPREVPLTVLVLSLAFSPAAAEPRPGPVEVAPPALGPGFAPGHGAALVDLLRATCPGFVLTPSATDPGKARYRLEAELTGEPHGKAHLALMLVEQPSLARVAAADDAVDLTPTRTPNGVEPSKPAGQGPLAEAALRLGARLFEGLDPAADPCAEPAPEAGWLAGAPAGPSGAELCAAVDEFYETRGPFARTYAMDEITALRRVPGGPGRLDAHVRYRYRFLDPAAGIEIPVGHDQRVFSLERRRNRWHVTGVGPYLSGEP